MMRSEKLKNLFDKLLILHKSYYAKLLSKFPGNIKKTWQLIKLTADKIKNKAILFPKCSKLTENRCILQVKFKTNSTFFQECTTQFKSQ